MFRYFKVGHLIMKVLNVRNITHSFAYVYLIFTTHIMSEGQTCSG